MRIDSSLWHSAAVIRGSKNSENQVRYFIKLGHNFTILIFTTTCSRTVQLYFVLSYHSNHNLTTQQKLTFALSSAMNVT